MTGTWHVVPDGARHQALLAVSHADQSWIIASILSRRPEEIRSHLACGTGMHRIRRGTRIHRRSRGRRVMFAAYVHKWRADSRFAGR
jgi:hypothetical protein